MSDLETRLSALERRVRELESGIITDLELLATDAERSTPPPRRPVSGTPWNDAPCWTCRNCSKILTEGREGASGHLAGSCRIHPEMSSGRWLERGERTGHTIRECADYWSDDTADREGRT